MLSTRSRFQRTPFELGRDRTTMLLTYRAGWDLWWLSVPCSQCGGTELPLGAQLSSARIEDVMDAVAHDVKLLGCPWCYALDRREHPHDEPEVWYDPRLTGWVVRVPDATSGGAILPLEISWFDTPRSVIYRAAADLVYAADALLDASCE